MAYSFRPTDCTHCGSTWFYQEDPANIYDVPDPCPVCHKLGDRSLLWFMRAVREASSDAERAAIRVRFDAAKGRSSM